MVTGGCVCVVCVSCVCCVCVVCWFSCRVGDYGGLLYVCRVCVGVADRGLLE